MSFEKDVQRGSRILRQEKMARVTIDDIAKKAGVTKGLVSRALTGKYNVSDKMRDEITRAAVALGYDFTKLRSKSKKRSKCLLVMSQNMLVNEAYWQPIIRAITSTLDVSGIGLEYFIYDDARGSDENISALKAIDASGYVFISNNPEKYLRYTESTNRPVVVIDPRSTCTGKHLQIKFSNVSTVYDLTRLLYLNGHKNLLFYGPKDAVVSFIEREQGFTVCVHELKEYGVNYYRVLFDNSQGYYADNKAFTDMLLAHPEITGIVCANDIIALNALASIKQLGKSVPQDYSVVGFDNIAESREGMMNLTTANVPREELGVEAARYLINHINSNQVKYSQIVIDCEIVTRGSIRNITPMEEAQ